MTITEFLTARLDEDEWDARPFTNELGASRPWAAAEVGGVVDNGPNPLGGLDGVVATATTHMAAVHIARHDPARVLADVAAKRRIVELCATWIAGGERVADGRDVPALLVRTEAITAETVLRALVQAHADHPDFDPAWRVDA